MLAVEDRGKACGTSPQLRMGGDVGDALTLEPDLTLCLAQPLKELRTRSRSHCTFSRL
jgi:hypothetical protein